MSDLLGLGAYNTNLRGVENGRAAARSGGSPASQGSLGITDFYKLLAAQLQYQDADNPMDTSEMMNQLVQSQMIGAITQMSTINTITYATSMVGKEVTMAEIDEQGRFTGEQTTGVITGIIIGDSPILFMNDKPYMMPQIMTVGKVPEDVLNPPKPDEPGEGGDTEGDGNTGEEGSTPETPAP